MDHYLHPPPPKKITTGMVPFHTGKAWEEYAVAKVGNRTLRLGA